MSGIVVASVAVLAVSVPLGLHTFGEIRDQRDDEVASGVVRDWLQNTDLQATRISISRPEGFLAADEEQVTIDVAGPNRPPEVESLARQLAQEFENPVEVRVRWTRRVESSARG